MTKEEAMDRILANGGVLKICQDLCMYSRGSFEDLGEEKADLYYRILDAKLNFWKASPDVFSTRYDEAVRSLIDAAIEQYFYRQAW